jgi:cyclophilin family peptidyl-prolyl cis-trans isomerase
VRNPDGLGFAAFGKVVRGMTVVRKIHGLEAEGASDSPCTNFSYDFHHLLLVPNAHSS